MSQRSNYGRVFQEVVSVEAWHSSFDPATKLATVHADVSFMVAKLGAERDCPVRFSLSLRRAEVSLIIPDREPLAVVQSSIAREIGPTGQRTLEITSGHKFEGKLSAGVDALSNTPLSLQASGSLFGDNSAKTSTSLTEKIGPFTVRHFTKDSAQCWEIFAEDGSSLIGKAWHPVLEPRLKIKKLNDSTLEPSAQLRVRCKKEDLIISSVSFKSPRILDHMGWQAAKTKEAAAAAYIKSRLVEYDLTPANFEEEYSIVFLADSVVSEEIS
ncbi:hypothetical protein IFR23_04830 [Sphingomonas sp. CFBP 13603]|uniref:hypothetical protein n=1 Tax=Sphingomonas sp. CFBP 13603 TaxID=2774040 RepID=UPI0018677D99|nr:hypothetical protein [Sphingomonas sp. CFBP 13603]MBE2991336.1 hypothetical protein [Sphingomonas sp. CFBP 13603]